MKNIFNLILLSFFITTFSIQSQTGPKDAGNTPGELSVSLSGATTYSVPLDMPPGIKNVVPNIAITYNSQVGSGIVGWGWNISGLSTITRIPSTKYHDGIIDEVDFDEHDRYALDGQRLMVKTGDYGGDGSIYETENYSNVKIIAYGVSQYGSNYGPDYFIAYYPDGSRAWYGFAGNSSGRLEWAINKWEDPQKNFIEYIYAKNGNLLRIESIKYGSRNGGSSPNEIKFVYQTRQRYETSYVAGVFFERKYILNYIDINTAGTLYRRYQIVQDDNSLNYERVTRIYEWNGTNVLEAIKFDYGETSKSLIRSGGYHPDLVDIDPEEDIVLNDDFTGDGEIDVLVYDKVDRNKIKVVSNFASYNGANGTYSSTFPNYVKEFSVPKFDALISGNVLSNNGKVLPEHGIVTIKDNPSSSLTSRVVFSTYAMTPTGQEYLYGRTWNAPTYKSESSCNDDYRYKTSKTFKSGDFNGDGILDVIALTFNYTETFCNPISCDDGGGGPQQKSVRTSTTSKGSGLDCCECTDYPRNFTKSYFIDLNKNKTSGYSNYSGQLDFGLRFFSDTENLFVIDYNGDGKSDLVRVSDGNISIYTLNQNNTFTKVVSFSDSKIDIDKKILSGDFNGDGKFDFASPEQENSESWHFFMGDGISFKKFTRDINIPYEISFENGISLNEFHYITQDFNSDGKTDILVHKIRFAKLTGNTTEENLLYQSSHFYSTTGPYFFQPISKLQTLQGNLTKGFPMILSGGNSNGSYNKYLYVRDSRSFVLKSNKQNPNEMLLSKVTNNGLIHEIDYGGVSTYGNDGSYTPSSNQSYPFVNVNQSFDFMVTKQIREIGSGMTRYKDFVYEGAMSHYGGLGFFGFEVNHQSNWYGNGVTRLWSSTKRSSQKRGAIVTEWTANTLFSSPTDPISRIDYNYNTELSSNKVFKNFAASVVSANNLLGTATTKSFVYDTYYNPTTITTSNSASSVVTTLSYYNNPTSNSDTYHIGRLKTKSISSTIDGSTFFNEEEYGYNNNLVTTMKKRGSGTPWVTDSFGHDTWGNVTQTSISATGLTTRTESFTYTSDGRYLQTQTDIEGLTTTYKTDANSGNLTRIVDPFGNATNYTYDGWNRIVTEVDYLGKTTSYTYTQMSDGGLETMIDRDQGQDEFEVTNAFGWVVLNRFLGLNNKWMGTGYSYDAAGRRVKTSEPFNAPSSQSTPSVWNEVLFDEYGRIIELREYTGKNTSITYNGLSSTATDGQRTVTTTRNAVGNIKVMTDNGGTINYKYHGNGSLKETDFDGQVTKVTIDAWGRKTKLIDPSAGTYDYEYNLFGELTKEKSPKGETIFEYDSTGKLDEKTITGDFTNLVLDYRYDADKFLDKIIGQDLENNLYYNYDYDYDTFKRLKTVIEDNDLVNFKKEYTYDSYGRPFQEIFTSNNKSDGTISNVRVRNLYESESGIHKEIVNDNNSASLWKLNDHDYRFQATSVNYGNGFASTREFDSYGLPEAITDSKSSNNSTTHALRMDYSFNAARKILESRENLNMSWNETFGHDNLDRLTTISGSVTKSQSYDGKGRITNNSNIGGYAYNSSKKYQLASLDLNASGQTHFQGHETQEVDYNAFKKPVKISEENKGKVNFTYGILQNRSRAWYGGTADNPEERRYRKHYSAISPVEIVEDKQTGTTKIITYVGGDAYSAPIAQIAKKSNSGGTEAEFHYLHRDYLGSILAITDSDGAVLEQRQFGAWGTVDKFLDSTGSEAIFDHNSIIGRGFTGHEHFFEVNLLHMNGRMYDPILGRFLSPDSHVQAPYNTQSFNRYGYVMNNPLVYFDPSGETVEGVVFGIVAATALFGIAKAFIFPAFQDYDGYVTYKPTGQSAPSPGRVKNSTNTASGEYGSNSSSGGFWNNLKDWGRGIGNAAVSLGERALVATAGALNAWSSNQLLGAGRYNAGFEGTSLESTFKIGQLAGDLASIVTGIGEIVGGVTLAAGGVLAVPFSGGLSLSGTAVGVGLISHGISATGFGIHNTGRGLSDLVDYFGKKSSPKSSNRGLRNGHLGGKSHPKTGVPFTKKGFPNFKDFLFKGGKNDVRINPTGTRPGDYSAANKAAGYTSTPKGYTWHHHQTTGRMQLVKSSIHSKTGHTGGFHLWYK